MKSTEPMGCAAALLWLVAWLPRRLRALRRRPGLRDPRWPGERRS